MSPRGLLAAAGVLWIALFLPGCEITDVVTQDGDDLLVVEAVLRTDLDRQRILLHSTLTSGASGAGVAAHVAVRTQIGREIVFQPASTPNLCLQSASPVPTACYVSPGAEGFWVQPGEEYELTVTTEDGRRLFGRTRVPGNFRLLQPSRDGRDGSCRLPPDTPLPLVWSRSAGAWSYLADLEISNLQAGLADRVPGEIPDPIRLQGLSISEADTTMTLPADFGVFQRTDFQQPLLRALQGGLPAGARAGLVIAAVDRNYVNAVRGGSFNPSGRVRIPSVVGDGTGFFGSMVPLSTQIWIVTGGQRPPCLGG